MERGSRLQAAGSRAQWARLGRMVLALLLVVFTLTACIGTTGSGIVSFEAYGAGLADLPPDTSVRGLSFVNEKTGWSITLTRAQLHIGALYLNRSVPVSGGQERECFLPGVYVAQVLSGRTIDTLSPELQRFPQLGTGTADHAITAEVWLTGNGRRVDEEDDRSFSPDIAEVAGTATRGAESMRFEGTITIGRNRRIPADDPARPGAHPMCTQRIVTPIPTSITPTDGGALVVRVDPRQWFANVELGELAPMSAESDLRRIPDDSEGAPAYNLFEGLTSASPLTYRFEWRP